MIDLLISLVSLTSLIIFLLEARTGGGFRSRWPAALWAVFLFLLSMLTLLRVVHNADKWSEGQVLMGMIAVANLSIAAALLLAWLYWTGRAPEELDRL
ncbi:MAG TPA: hypothetical protein VLT87_18155 [Thermoanaerobaculia bacterium]|nr:hypothetical protein [Thermoanaerobaculia bacterium]